MSCAAKVSLYVINFFFVATRIMKTYIIEPNREVYSYAPNQRYLITPLIILAIGAWGLSSVEITILQRGLRRLETMVFSLQNYDIEELLRLSGLNSKIFKRTL